MTYSVREIYYTIQGEGAQTGLPAVFCRFSGCNLWSGREADRDRAVCRFCDTRFVGTDGLNGGRYEAAQLADRIVELWPTADEATPPLVVCTGGEPLLQLDEVLIGALHARGVRVAVETNGTITPPAGIDWLCVSPKVGAPLRATRGDELKLVYPQPGVSPEAYEALDFRHFFLQPLDDARREINLVACVRYCLEHPRWRLSLQTQKMTGLQMIESAGDILGRDEAALRAVGE